MIQINLLPDELKGRKAVARAAGPSRAGVSPLVIAILALMAVALAAAGWGIGRAVLGARRTTTALKEDLAKKEKEYNARLGKFTELRLLEEQLSNQIEVLRSLSPEDRVLWSEKLNMLAYLAYPNVYITKLVLSEATQMVESADSVKRRKEWEDSGKIPPAPQIVKIPIITQTLKITSVATGNNERIRLENALKFWRVLQEFRTENALGKTVSFMDGFVGAEPNTGYTSKDYFKRKVTEFTFTLKTKPMGGQAAAPQPKKAAAKGKKAAPKGKAKEE